MRLLVLNDQDILIRCDLIEINIAVELIDPFVCIGDLQLKWREDFILIVDLLAVEPGVAVVELEHVQSSLYGIYGVLQLSNCLLMGEEESFHDFGACDLA